MPVTTLEVFKKSDKAWSTWAFIKTLFQQRGRFVDLLRKVVSRQAASRWWMVCVWGQVAFRLTFVARHGRTQVLVFQHDNVVIKNSLRSKKIHAMLPTFTISRGVVLMRDILGRWGFVRGSAVSHGVHFDGLMSGLCCAVLCGLVGRWRGKQRLVSGRTGELLGFLSLTLLDN